MNKYIKFSLNILRGRKSIKDIFKKPTTPDIRESLLEVLNDIDFEKYEKSCNSNSIAIKPNSDDKINIFTFWYDGWKSNDSLPKVVLKCRDNLIKYYKDNPAYNVIFLDKDNMFEYVNPDDVLYTEYKNNKISTQVLSDLLRLAVLLKHGGVWVDSTILFLGDKFDFESFFDYSEFNSIFDENYYMIGNECFSFYKGYEQYWCSFMLSAWKESNIVSRAYKFLKQYIIEKNYNLIYLCIDLAIMFATYQTNGSTLSRKGYEVLEVMYSYYNFNYKNKSIAFYESTPFKMNWRIDTTRHIKAIEKYINKLAKK